jgi:hypothetical protein
VTRREKMRNEDIKGQIGAVNIVEEIEESHKRFNAHEIKMSHLRYPSEA